MQYQDALKQIIQKYRVKQGLSVAELGWYSGISRPYMANIENGRRNITLSVLIAVAKTLEIPVSKIFKEAEKLMEREI